MATACFVRSTRARRIFAQGIESQEFFLKVTLIDSAARAEIQTKIAPEKAVEFSELHHGTKITVKGDLGARQKNSYYLRPTIAEWTDEKNNSSENYELDMVQGVAQSPESSHLSCSDASFSSPPQASESV